MESTTRSAIGLETRDLECLVGIRTGEAQSVSLSFCHSTISSTSASLTTIITGLATNFLLIESLQRFYQYYGDDLQVCMNLRAQQFVSLIDWDR